MIRLFTKQQDFFLSKQSRDYNFRLQQLKTLRKALEDHETDIADALFSDLQKSPKETYITETGIVLRDIRIAIKNLKKWMSPQKVHTPLLHQPGQSYVYKEPYGVTLIIGAWNYPVQLLLAPLVSAIAAGNPVILKPAEDAKHTSTLIKKIFDKYFEKEFILCIEGDAKVSQMLLEQPFSHVFFTGSTAVGKIVMTAAAKNLAHVTLELGGVNPCIVDKNINIDIAARRIAWGKFLNAGQVCLAPNYVLVHEDIKEKFVHALIKETMSFYNGEPKSCATYSRIINKKHTNRLEKLLIGTNILLGGEVDAHECYIAPTIVDGVSWDHPLITEETFGPILPVMSYRDLDDIFPHIKERGSPLACYIFSSKRKIVQKVISELRYGGGCVNDVITHIAVDTLPFGGVGESGTGRYHGKFGFDQFSHTKSIFKRSIFYEMISTKLRYSPYKAPYKIFKMLFRFF